MARKKTDPTEPERSVADLEAELVKAQSSLKTALGGHRKAVDRVVKATRALAQAHAAQAESFEEIDRCREAVRGMEQALIAARIREAGRV